MEACRELSRSLGLHLSNQPPCATSPIRGKYSARERPSPSLRSTADRAKLDRLGVLLQAGTKG
jgi:hypothetical protein